MTSVEQYIQSVDASGVLILRDKHGYVRLNTEMSFPFVVISMCTGGSARAMYNMREFTVKKNDLAFTMPGHIMSPLEYSDDYSYTSMAVSRKILDELRNYLFSHDYAKFYYYPVCSLTETQAQRLLTIMEQIEIIASHTDLDFAHRRHLLLAQLSVGYEFLNYYRRDFDRELKTDPQSAVYAQFCDLVVAHFRESKEVQYYANLLHYHPKHLSRIVQSVTNGISPRQWIESMVVAHAKRLIATNPQRSLKQIAYYLGFDEPSSFYRYFKRVAGVTAKEYRESL